MMIINGNGVVNSGSSNSTITNYVASSDSFDFSQLKVELEQLLITYSQKEKEDVYGQCAIKEAIIATDNKDMEKLYKSLNKFSGLMKNIGKSLSLNLVTTLLVNMIT